jgi:hypothetical protein
MSARSLIALAVALSATLIVVYLALGGADYEPTPVADPCEPRAWTSPEDVEEYAQQFTLSALDGAACELEAATGTRISRETLALALATPDTRREFASDYGIDDAELEAAVRAGLLRAIDDAEAAGALPGVIAAGLRATVAQIPVEDAIALIEDARDLFGSGGALLDQLDGLLP